MADPFDFANVDSPAPAGGMSPDFWHNLQMFGGALAAGANARNSQGFLTYGPDFGGPFGAALMQTGQQSLETAKTKSALAAQGAETQGAQIRNQVAALGLPIARLRARAASDPAFMDQLMNGTPQLPQAPQDQSSAAPAASFSGGGGALASNPDLQPVIASTAAKYGIPAPLASAMFQQESSMGTNPAAKGNVGQVTQSTAANPGYGMAALAPGAPPAQNIDFSLQYLRKAGDAAGVKDWNDPSQWGVALKAYNGGGDPNYVQNVARWLPKDTQVGGAAAQKPFQVAQAGSGAIPVPGQPQQQAQAQQPPQQAPQQGGGGAVPGQGQFSPGYITPEVAYQRAEAARQQAIHLQMLGFDATPATQLAQSWQDYGQKQSLQQTAPQSGRGPGSFVRMPATGQVIQTPLEYEVTGPDMRKYRITQNAVETGQPYVRPADVPSWAPPGTLSVAQAEPSPGEHEGAVEAGRDAFGEKSRSQYSSAAGTLRTMDDMEQQVDRLNAGGPGWYNTGAGAAAKLDFMKQVNGIAQSVGIPTASLPFDADKLASGEDVTKQAKLAGMQVLSTMFGGSREAASIIHSTQAAVPNIENTPQGFKLLVNGYKEAARWQMDQHAFMTNWYAQHAGNMVGADVAFAQQNRPEMYTRRGISQVRPYEIPGSDPAELKRFLPGTQVIVKADPTHTPRVIPGDTEIPLQMPQQQPALGAPPQ